METNNEIIYNWSCNTVDVYPIQGELTNVIYRVHYRVSGGIDYSTTPITASRIGTQGLNTDVVTNFIPFDQVGSEQTIAWTKSAMGETLVAEIEAEIANQIELQKNPVSVTMVVPDPPQDPPIMDL